MTVQPHAWSECYHVACRSLPAELPCGTRAAEWPGLTLRVRTDGEQFDLLTTVVGPGVGCLLTFEALSTGGALFVWCLSLADAVQGVLLMAEGMPAPRVPSAVRSDLAALWKELLTASASAAAVRRQEMAAYQPSADDDWSDV